MTPDPSAGPDASLSPSGTPQGPRAREPAGQPAPRADVGMLVLAAVFWQLLSIVCGFALAAWLGSSDPRSRSCSGTECMATAEFTLLFVGLIAAPVAIVLNTALITVVAVAAALRERSAGTAPRSLRRGIVVGSALSLASIATSLIGVSLLLTLTS